MITVIKEVMEAILTTIVQKIGVEWSNKRKILIETIPTLNENDLWS